MGPPMYLSVYRVLHHIVTTYVALLTSNVMWSKEHHPHFVVPQGVQHSSLACFKGCPICTVDII